MAWAQFSLLNILAVLGVQLPVNGSSRPVPSPAYQVVVPMLVSVWLVVVVVVQEAILPVQVTAFIFGFFQEGTPSIHWPDGGRGGRPLIPRPRG